MAEEKEDWIERIQWNAEMQQKIWHKANILAVKAGFKSSVSFVWWALCAAEIGLEKDFPQETAEYHKRLEELKKALRKEGLL